jgi:hypothetical protein
MAPVGERTYALLEWAESSIGCGLKTVEAVVRVIGGESSKKMK